MVGELGVQVTGKQDQQPKKKNCHDYMEKKERGVLLKVIYVSVGKKRRQKPTGGKGALVGAGKNLF